jgi:ABC-type antimicrobial peptide transport system permease subunit
LNLYRPAEPRILGVSQAMIDRGGFVFAGSIAESPEERENPWRLLDSDRGGNGAEADQQIVPAIGDYNTLTWVLQLGLGDQIQLTGDRGEPVTLQIVGMLRGSLFQGELLIGETNFVRHFPSQSGYRFFLIEAGTGIADQVATLLERNLTEYGFEVTTTAARLAGYMAVENTYLSTFQLLGGLGLLLGTFGLATVMLRNVFERRGELALMRCLGFRKSWLAWLVLSENLMLLVAGLAGGVLSALLAVAPHLAGAGAAVPVGWLALMLALVLAAGLAAGLVGVAATLRAELLPALRAE